MGRLRCSDSVSLVSRLALFSALPNESFQRRGFRREILLLPSRLDCCSALVSFFTSRTTRTSSVDSSRTSARRQLPLDDRLADRRDEVLLVDAVRDRRDDHLLR